VDLTPQELDELLSDSYRTTWSALMKPVSVTQQSDAVQVAFQAGLATIKSAVLFVKDRGGRDWNVTLGAPNSEVREFLEDRKYELLLRGDATLYRKSQHSFARALLDGSYADAAKRMVEMLVLAKKHSLLEKERDIGGVLFGRLHDGALQQPYFFSMEVSGERRGGRGRENEADGVLVATPEGGDAPVMVVVELKRAKGAAPTTTTVQRDVDAAVNQVYNKKYFANGVDAVSRFCKTAKGGRPPFCPADDQPLSGPRVGVAMVVAVPPVGAVGEDLIDTESSVPSQHKIMDDGTHVGTTTITSSGCVVDADRRVAVVWKTFPSDYVPAKVAN
jgi:hypothetical protein